MWVSVELRGDGSLQAGWSTGRTVAEDAYPHRLGRIEVLERHGAGGRETGSEPTPGMQAATETAGWRCSCRRLEEGAGEELLVLER